MSITDARISGHGLRQANALAEFILWQEIVTAWDSPSIVPSIEAMDRLRLHFLNGHARPAGDSTRVATLMRIAVELGRRGDPPRPQEAWRSLRALADDLDFGKADAGREVPATEASAEPDSYVDSSSENTAGLWKELRVAWSQRSSVPSPISQRLLLDALQAKGGDDLAARFGGEITAISGWLASADNENRKTAWSALAAIARWFSFRDMTIRQVILGRLPPGALVGDMSSGTSSPEFDALARICDRAVTIRTGRQQTCLRYPSRIPRAWLASGRVNVSTVMKACGAGWRVVDASGCKFIVPPDEILGMLLPPCDYERLVSAGIASRSGIPHTSGLLSSALDDFISVLRDICTRRLNLHDQDYILVPDDYFLPTARIAGPDDVIAAIRDGHTLVYADGGAYLVPPSAIGSISKLSRNIDNKVIDPRMLLRLAGLGIIGICGGADAPWRGLRGADQEADGDPSIRIALAFRASKPVSALFGTIEWSGGGHGRAVEVGGHRVAAVQPLIEKANGGSLNYDEFSDALSQADAAVYKLFLNMTRPHGGSRKANAVLATEIGISQKTVARWEDILKELCRHRGWTVYEKGGMAKLASDGKVRAKQLASLVARARAERLGYGEFVALLREFGDPVALGVFLDLTAPDGGKRKSVNRLAQDLGAVRARIDKLRAQFAELCTDMSRMNVSGWKDPSGGSSSGSPAGGGFNPAGPPMAGPAMPPMAGPIPSALPGASGNPMGFSAMQFTAGNFTAGGQVAGSLLAPMCGASLFGLGLGAI